MDRFSEQTRKKRKLAETENTPNDIMNLSNNAANDTLSYESLEKNIFGSSNDSKISENNKRHKKSEAENSPKTNNESKVINTMDQTSCEIGELTTNVKSGYLSSIKIHKKKKHKVHNDETISDSNILGFEELKNDAGVELQKKKKHHKKKHKPESFDELENVSKSKIEDSDGAENNIIFNELYKRKKHNKLKKIEVDKLSLCLNTNIDSFELCENNLNNEIVDGVHKNKKTRYKSTTAGSLLATTYMEPNFISNITVSDDVIAKSNTEDQNIFKLNKKNVANSETKAKKHHKKKYEYVDYTREFDCVIDSVVTENLYDDEISKKSEKKKHELTDEYVEKDMQNLEKDTSIEFLRDLSGHKKKKNKHKLLYAGENVSSHQKSAVDKSEERKKLDIFDAHQKKDKRKHVKVDKISMYKTIDTNANKIDQDSLDCETLSRFHNKKKKKKHKLLDWDIQESTVDTSRSRILDVLDAHKRKDNNKQIEVDEVSVCKTKDLDLNVVGINENYLNSGKKKKKKHDPFDETEYVSDSKTARLNTTKINQNDLNNDTLNRYHKKKKKKNKHKLFNPMETISDSNVKRSDVDEQEENIVLGVSDTQKRNDKCKETSVDKIFYSKYIDSNDLTIGTIDKSKKKKHRHKIIEAEDMPNTVVSSNDLVYDGHLKGDEKESIVQNSVANGSSETKKRKCKKYMDSEIEKISDILKEEGKDIISKALVKENNDQAFENYKSFDSFTCDLDDVPVPFPIPLLHESETVGTIPPEKRAYLEENGVTIYTGKWTKTEDDILKRNFLKFGLEFGVNNPYQLLGINQNHKQVEIAKFLSAKHFWVRLGKDLDNRSLRSIYMRARKLLNPLNYKGKLTAEEAAQLKEAHELVGNKWTRISDMLSRSDDKCHTAFRWYKSDINKGKWSPEEEEKLIEAIKVVTGTEDISANNLNNISWKEVANYVPTRNEFQCYRQWVEHHAWDPSVTEKKRWEKHLYGKLIYLIKDKYCYKSDHEIDWRELHKHFIDVTPSYAFLRKKWLYLKGKLPKGITFSPIDALAKMYLNSYKLYADKDVINQ